MNSVLCMPQGGMLHSLTARLVVGSPRVPAQLARLQAAYSIFQLRSAVRTEEFARKVCMSVACVAEEATEVAAAEAEAGPKVAKRRVALYIGYEGTAYRGLQAQKLTAPDETIEEILQQAIFAAGGILESNMDPSRLRWSRSSRTDKRVHSLATVIGMKIECDPDSFDSDPDGVGIAQGINAHLPPSIRVFSAQRVTKSFNARTECVRRGYHYHLPASFLGLKGDGGDGDREVLRLLAEAWGQFQGNHPFHNYTQRRLYRHAQRDSRNRGASSRREASEDEDDSDGAEVELPPAWSEAEEAAAAAGQSASGQEAAAGAAPEVRRGEMQLAWKGEPDEADLVSKRHFRFIEACSVSNVMALVPGGRPCVRLSVRGASFMLHQIRHMVGAAAAVALGHIPPELVQISLATPARVNLPLAPPSTLILADAEFMSWRASWDKGKPAAVTKWSGDSLTLRAPGRELQQRFALEALFPAVDALLGGEEWEQWGGELARMWYEPGDLAALREPHAQYRRLRAERKEWRAQNFPEEEATAAVEAR